MRERPSLTEIVESLFRSTDSDGPPSTWALAVVGLCLLMTLLIFGVWAGFIVYYAVDVPRMDQLDTPALQIRAMEAGTLDLATLTAQHNESRKLVPNVLSLALYQMRGYYDLRAEILLGWAICVLLVAALARLAWLTTRSRVSTAILTALFTGLLWSSHTLHFHFFSVTFERLIPQLMLVVTMAVLIGHGTRWYTIPFACVACVASQFSYASGVVIWPLVVIFVVISERHSLATKRWHVAAIVGAGVISSALYFWDYHQPGSHSNLTAVFGENPLEMGAFVLLFIGNAVTSGHVWRAGAFGAFVLTAFVTLVVTSIRAERSRELERAQLAWMMVGLYSVGQATLSMIARLPMGFENALRSDYVAHPLYAYTAVVALGLLAAQPRVRQGAAILGMVGAVSLSATVVKPAMWRGVRQYSSEFRYARACLLLAKVHEEPECLDLIFPRVDRRLIMLELISPYLRRPILEEVAVGPAADGVLSSWSETGGELTVAGTARFRGEPADAVVITVDEGSTERLIRIEPVGLKRPSAPRDDGGRLLRSGWATELELSETLPNRCALRFRAMDNDLGVLRPIEGLAIPGCELEPTGGRRSEGDERR